MARKNSTTATTEVEPEAPAEVTYSAKDLAALCDTDPKSFRRWLRANTSDRANKGGRWIFTEESKAQFVEAFKNRGSAKATEATLPDAD